MNSELNVLALYMDAGFHVTPKFHMLQHIYCQFEGDCAPRYSYCFAEESKNEKMSDLGQKASNHETLPDRCMLMHEMWASSGRPTIAKLRKRRLDNAAKERPAKKNQPATLSASSSDVDIDLD